MFESLLDQSSGYEECKGEIISLEGDIYIVRLRTPQGELVESAVHRMPNLAEAKLWMKHHKVNEFDFMQSSAYAEMISLSG